MIRIFHFISDTNFGGAGRLLCNQIKNMPADEFQMTVALPKNSKLKEKLSPLPCNVIECKHLADTSISSSSLVECYNILKTNMPDIVHSHASLSSRIAASALKIDSRIFTKHCAFPITHPQATPFIKQATRFSGNALSTAIIATSDSARKNLIQLGYDQNIITTIINGAEPIALIAPSQKRFIKSKYGLNKDSFVISIFARLEEYKGHKAFIKAARICKSRYPCFKFLIVGNGSQLKELKEYARKLGVEDTVHFTGFCDDVAPLFNITDVNVNCSTQSETSSLSLSEGMSLGIPSVASDLEGNSYLVKNTFNGLLFPVNNADALASCLIRLYRDKTLYSKCSLGAHTRYKNELSSEIMAKKMTLFYKNEYRKNKK